ncbi:hypothetical protein STRIP9103_02926 [Streptomyces ipomoeae 91-03]|uniref:Uncharacterized protein n=1 Tax=Streptomyces ipomoeae 91-03 TaxID=698759 RepID=L1KYV6_9ACTN|nr:hypothetical protein STRIP9103_02926 [Streptomyces ipomoeae 91-03]
MRGRGGVRHTAQRASTVLRPGTHPVTRPGRGPPAAADADVRTEAAGATRPTRPTRAAQAVRIPLPLPTVNERLTDVPILSPSPAVEALTVPPFVRAC